MRSVSRCNCQTIPPSSSLSARSHLPCKAKEAFLKVICLCQNGSFKIVETGVPDCPYSEKSNVCFFSHQKALRGLGHSRGSSRRRLFCFFFLRLKKEDIPHSQRTPVPTSLSVTIDRATSPGVRGFIKLLSKLFGGSKPPPYVIRSLV